MKQLSLVPPKAPSGAEKVRQRLKAQKPDSVLQCRCGGRELLPVKGGMIYRNGKAVGGVTQYLCVQCLMRGERVVVA